VLRVLCSLRLDGAEPFAATIGTGTVDPSQRIDFAETSRRRGIVRASWKLAKSLLRLVLTPRRRAN